MIARLVLSVLMGFASNSFADRMSKESGEEPWGGSFLEDTVSKPPPPPQKHIKQPIRSEVIPLPPLNLSGSRPEAASLVKTPAVDSLTSPQAPARLPVERFQATVATNGGCPDPIAHPKAANTPVKVYVNQQDQTIRIETPDLPTPMKSQVSTGGGLKIPNGRLKKAPYCAQTPRKERLVISAVTPDMFKGTNCTAEQIRAKSTVFSNYKTDTFTDKNGRPVPLPSAVRIAGGIFFHAVPPSYRDLIGHNVSGDCVRLLPKVAKFLQQQALKYGAIEVSISDPPKVERKQPQYCDQQMVADARRRQEDHNILGNAPLSTGTEDNRNDISFLVKTGQLPSPPRRPIGG